MSDGAALYIDQVAGSSALQPHNWVGQRSPLHAISNGKVLLGGLPDREGRAALVGRRPRWYSATSTLARARSAGLGRARAQPGLCAFAVDELEVGLAAVAAPIRNVHGDVVASVSVSGPTFRLDGRPGRTRSSHRLVAAAAIEVSHRLGWGEREYAVVDGWCPQPLDRVAPRSRYPARAYGWLRWKQFVAP